MPRTSTIPLVLTLQTRKGFPSKVQLQSRPQDVVEGADCVRFDVHQRTRTYYGRDEVDGRRARQRAYPVRPSRDCEGWLATLAIASNK